jgi:protocatechuate 3,4-dioxygenase alpha subunit
MLQPTPSQTVGPYFAIGFSRPLAELVPPATEGAIRLEGRLLDGAGAPIPDGVVEIWQANREGVYEGGFGFGRCGTDADGRWSFVTVKPGPVGGQAPYVTAFVFARGLLKHLHTRIYFGDEEEANESDPVLSALPPGQAPETLVAREQDGGYSLDLRLQGEGQTVFFAL